MSGRGAAALFETHAVGRETVWARSAAASAGPPAEFRSSALSHEGAQALRPRVIRVLLVGLSLLLIAPMVAAAHGPVAPVATSYLARVSRAPAGLEAKIIDGYVRIWLHAPPSETVVVLDYRGAPYLRFSPAGVAVNQNSAMYYLNQTPVAATPPTGLNRATPPDWQPVSDGHDYEWHDGRLQALASVALTPGATYLGTWNIPLLIDGQRGSISGGLWHSDTPSPVWFWPIVVLLACVLAAWRIRSPLLDARIARGLGAVALAALSVAALDRGLHGRPNLDPFSLIELAATLAFAGWGLRAVASGRAGYFTYFMIAAAAIWEGVDLLPTLLYGYVLAALPAFLTRTATVLCLGTGAGILPLVFRLADQRQPNADRSRAAANVESDHEGLEETYDAG